MKYDIKNRDTILYKILVETEIGPVQKIGITCNSIERRYSDEELPLLTKIDEIIFPDRQSAIEQEKLLKEKYKEFLINPIHNPLRNGHTEMYIGCDVQLEI